MFLFKRDSDYEYIVSHIKSNVSPAPELHLEPDEVTFFKAFVKTVKKAGRDPKNYKFTRLSNGTFNIYQANGYYVGKVKLIGKNKFIQYMKNSLVSDTIYGEVDDIISNIPRWLKK